MRHGIAFRKLSRTSSHREAMLRNMVSSLFEHEQIQTTVAKAKEASRIAEWVITWGKQGTETQRRRAQGFLMNPTRTMPKLFNELATRYASRSGGFTRVHQFGHRKGDHAPQAILELVDNPNDLRFHMTARIVGRQLARLVRENKSSEKAVLEWATATSNEGLSKQPEVYKLLSDMTRLHTKKALQFATRFSTKTSSTSPTSSDSTQDFPSTSTSIISSTDRLSLKRFDDLARESFFRTSAVSKVPVWDVDLGKYEDVLLNAKNIKENAPVTLPGHGRKVWAGQEDLAKRYENEDSLIAELDEEAEWEDEPAATTTLNAEDKKAQRTADLKKKMRHPGGRNGAQGQRSAIARAKGHQAPPRGMAERRLRADMPVSRAQW